MVTESLADKIHLLIVRADLGDTVPIPDGIMDTVEGNTIRTAGVIAGTFCPLG